MNVGIPLIFAVFDLSVLHEVLVCPPGHHGCAGGAFKFGYFAIVGVPYSECATCYNSYHQWVMTYTPNCSECHHP